MEFGNLFSRLLTLPILTRKKEIITLLDHLSEPVQTSGTQRSPSPQRPDSRAYEAQKAELKNAGFRHRPPSRDGGAPTSRVPDRTARRNGQAGATRDAGVDSDIKEDQEQGSRFQAVDSLAPSEPALLRDLPFTLQGLSSTNLSFESAFKLSLPANLPLPIVSLLHSLAEPSLLYRSLSEYVKSREEGLISQSLRAATGIELRSYLSLIATLEGEIRRTIASLQDKDNVGSTAKVGVTLKRCVVWTREATMGLRLMSLMAEESKSNISRLQENINTNRCRQKGWAVNHVATYIFNSLRRPICEHLCGAYSCPPYQTLLQHASAVDLRWRAFRSVPRVLCH